MKLKPGPLGSASLRSETETAISGHQQRVYVADVAGKGLPAALMMAALSAKILSVAPLYTEVDQLLASVDKEMYGLMSEEGFFATMVLCKYRPGSGKVQIAGAGHLSPLWISDREVRELSKLDGLPIGVDYEAEDEKIASVLSPGEARLVITDGIAAEENKDNELFGDDRLADYFEVADGPPRTEGLLERIDSWRGNAAMNDDLTMVEIWRNPPR